MIILPKLNQNDKVMILGARGNLGSQIMRFFGNEYRLICWDREDIDLRHKEEIWEKIVPMKPHYIINTVAYNAVDLCEKNEQEKAAAFYLNSSVPAELGKAALELDAVLIHFVSDYVFPGSLKSGYKEDDATGAISVYGQSKEQGEKEILKLAERGLKYYLVRTSKLFGPPGESVLSKPSFFDIMHELANQEKSLKAVDREEISCFTYTPDLARAVLALVEEKAPYGIYHLVNEGPASWFDGARFLFKLTGQKPVLKPVSGGQMPRPAKRPKYSVLLNTKRPKLRPWKKALKEYVGAYYK